MLHCRNCLQGSSLGAVSGLTLLFSAGIRKENKPCCHDRGEAKVRVQELQSCTGSDQVLAGAEDDYHEGKLILIWKPNKGLRALRSRENRGCKRHEQLGLS